MKTLSLAAGRLNKHFVILSSILTLFHCDVSALHTKNLSLCGLPLFFPFYSFQTISGCWEIKHSVQQIKCKNLSGTVGEQLEYHNLQYVKYSVHLSDKQKELERLFQKVLDLMSVYVPPSRLCHLSAPHSSRPALIFIGWGRAELQQLEDSFWSFDTQMTREQTSAETANSFQRTHGRGE